MKFKATFKSNSKLFKADFGQVIKVGDGGYERGYAEGYKKGNDEGHEAGYNEGLAARTYETWTVTYADGTVEEKEVALL